MMVFNNMKSSSRTSSVPFSSKPSNNPQCRLEKLPRELLNIVLGHLDGTSPLQLAKKSLYMKKVVLQSPDVDPVYKIIIKARHLLTTLGRDRDTILKELENASVIEHCKNVQDFHLEVGKKLYTIFKKFDPKVFQKLEEIVDRNGWLKKAPFLRSLFQSVPAYHTLMRNFTMFRENCITEKNKFFISELHDIGFNIPVKFIHDQDLFFGQCIVSSKRISSVGLHQFLLHVEDAQNPYYQASALVHAIFHEALQRSERVFLAGLLPTTTGVQTAALVEEIQTGQVADASALSQKKVDYMQQIVDAALLSGNYHVAYFIDGSLGPYSTLLEEFDQSIQMDLQNGKWQSIKDLIQHPAFGAMRLHILEVSKQHFGGKKKDMAVLFSLTKQLLGTD